MSRSALWAQVLASHASQASSLWFLAHWSALAACLSVGRRLSYSDGMAAPVRVMLVRGKKKRSQRAGVIERRPNPAGRGSLYYLTAAGQELADVTLIHLGRLPLRDAERQGAWNVDGSPALVRAMPTWGGLYSRFSGIRRARTPTPAA